MSLKNTKTNFGAMASFPFISYAYLTIAGANTNKNKNYKLENLVFTPCSGFLFSNNKINK